MQLDPVIISILALVLSAATAMFTGFSFSVMLKSYRSEHDWNRRKATHDSLLIFTSGQSASLREKIVKIVGEEMWVHRNYNDAKAELSEEDLKKLNNALNRLLNLYELYSLQIRNNVLDENISYYYLAHALPSVYEWSKSFIEQLRFEHNERHLFIELEYLAEQWNELKKQNAEKFKNATLSAKKYKPKLGV